MTTEAVDLPEHRKARGAFFTPPELSAFAVDWAVRSPEDSVLEPSAGEAAFMLAAATRLRVLGAANPRLSGHELHAETARRAESLLAAQGVHASIEVGDFLEQVAVPQHAAVVGNPPYIRFHGFTGTSRAAGHRASQAQGVALTNLASSWAPFVVHSAAFLRPGGRLALVLPAELLSSNYAAPVRAFLLRRFGSLRLVLFDRQVFPGVQTEALLLLAEGEGGTDEVAFGRVHRLGDLPGLTYDAVLRPTSHDAKWTTALVSGAAAAAQLGLVTGGDFTTLGGWGRLKLGAVTGNNSFFTLSPQEVERWKLAPSDVAAISPPGSSHLRALSVTKISYAKLGTAGQRTQLFLPADPSPAAWRYIRHGEARDVDQAYKCRVRKPWWQVPVPAAPDLFFTYMNAETVQLCANPLSLRHLNSIHGVYLDDAHRNLRNVLAVATVNSATMLSAEVVGRAYGGGILKMEPREGAQLAVPSPQTLNELRPQLARITPSVRAALSKGQLAAAVALVDQTLLVDGLGMPAEQIQELRRGRNLLAHRRRARTKQ